MSTTQDVEAKLQTVAPSQAVVERVAALEDVDHTELDPLFTAIDPDALDALVGAARSHNSPLQVDFTYNGHDVTVTSDGVVHVDEDEVVEGSSD